MDTRQDDSGKIEEGARAFDGLFRQMEHAMKRCDFCNDNKENAKRTGTSSPRIWVKTTLKR